MRDSFACRLDKWNSTIARCPRLRRVRAPVEDRPPGTVTRAEAADAAALEESSFSRAFRAQTGVTYQQWSRALRVAHALALMLEGDLALAEVAQYAGFGSLRSMERAFHAFLGVSPRAYRSSLRQPARS